ncbi:hypothetical protein BUALT_Bualt02G0222000 [Buddleja alternifolia]|uniref:Uncharacterized protein n=1 Tax=Buddleja alternifolia TaxID=168488 RepID=A0AAV6Y4H8_9LAMI|nr:hypothetical protein BUALT_Bualt02G0222000 [Buddleja alternifolia]
MEEPDSGRPPPLTVTPNRNQKKLKRSTIGADSTNSQDAAHDNPNLQQGTSTANHKRHDQPTATPNAWQNNIRDSWNRKEKGPVFYTGEGEPDDMDSYSESNEEEPEKEGSEMDKQVPKQTWRRKDPIPTAQTNPPGGNTSDDHGQQKAINRSRGSRPIKNTTTETSGSRFDILNNINDDMESTELDGVTTSQTKIDIGNQPPARRKLGIDKQKSASNIVATEKIPPIRQGHTYPIINNSINPLFESGQSSKTMDLSEQSSHFGINRPPEPGDDMQQLCNSEDDLDDDSDEDSDEDDSISVELEDSVDYHRQFIYYTLLLLLTTMAKKHVKYCVVDAFTDSAFKGNPAAVCLLEEERDDEWLQAVAREFNISETCYLIRLSDHSIPTFRLRWFTPVLEVELCGHATLAASHFLFAYGLVKSDIIEFSTLSGILTAKRVPETKVSDQNANAPESFLIELDFPVVPITEYDSAGDLSTISKSLNGASITEIHKTTTSEDLLVVLPSGEAVVEVEPHFDEIRNSRSDELGILITGRAPEGSGFDFFGRFFCPKNGINEDPVTGSAHCSLAPYWSKKLGKCDFIAYQASPRSGVLNLHFDEKNQRVLLRGKAVAVMEGSLLV